MLRAARVGDRLPSRVLAPASVRGVEATALLVPGGQPATEYAAQLTARAADFAAWDGRLVVTDPDGATAHRLLVVDRYNQVYAVHDAIEARQLPDAEALTEWFRFLATACPECGVIDDPLLAGPTP